MEIKQIKEEIIKGNAKEVSRLTKLALGEGISPQEVLQVGFIAGMKVVGDRMKKNEIFIPEVLISARAMQQGLEILEPHLIKQKVKPTGIFLIGTVKGDLHDIGKNLVAMMMKGAGFKIIDMGINVTVDKFISAIKEENPDLVGMSALLTTTMMEMKANINTFRQKGINTKIIIGGAPLSEKFANEIGADGYAPDAASAPDEAKRILKIRN